MSFSANVKKEIGAIIPQDRHCQLAEFAAIFSLCGKVMISEDNSYAISINTENVIVAKKSFSLLKETFQVVTDIVVKNHSYKKIHQYQVKVSNSQHAFGILQELQLVDPGGDISEKMKKIAGKLLKEDCCKMTYLRGAFLASGSISDPVKGYHFEIVCPSKQKGQWIQAIINQFSMEAKLVQRKKNYVVYLKEASQIVDLLNVMQAHSSLMELENVRIIKDMRNTVNRKVNCETANINKTVSAAVKQVEEIEYIRDHYGFENLEEPLKDLAMLRLEYTEASLKELGELIDPPVGKSGINHRLRKLSKLATELKQEQEEL